MKELNNSSLYEMQYAIEELQKRLEEFYNGENTSEEIWNELDRIRDMTKEIEKNMNL